MEQAPLAVDEAAARRQCRFVAFKCHRGFALVSSRVDEVCQALNDLDVAAPDVAAGDNRARDVSVRQVPCRTVTPKAAARLQAA